MLTTEEREKVDRVVKRGSDHEARAILGADCDRLLALRAAELLSGVGNGPKQQWDETLCKDCSAKLAEPTKTTRCPRCAAIKREETKR